MHRILLIIILIICPVAAFGQKKNEPTKEELAGLRKRVVYPKLVKHVPAVYPPKAAAENRQGIVYLTVSLDETGKVMKVEIRKSLFPDLDEAARQAVLKFEFSPATIDGKAIAVKIPIAYPFKLTQKAITVAAPADPDKPPTKPASTTSAGDEKKLPPGPPDAAGKRDITNKTPSATSKTPSPTPDSRLKQPPEVPPNAASADEQITVTGKNEKRVVTRYTLELTEIQTIPGTQGDAVRGIQNMPGVARAPFNLGLLVVRGSAPRNTKVFFEGLELPGLFHFLGLSSVLNTDMIRKMDFYPGNFSARYGRATGGIIDIGSATPRTKSFSGYIDIDLWDGGAFLKGPVGDGAFALSLRRSWIDGILVNLPDVAVSPVYYDYQGILAYPLFGGSFKLLVLGSDDRLKVNDTEPLRFTNSFQKIIALWTKRSGKDSYRLSIGGGRSDTEFMYNPENLDWFYTRINWRNEYQRTFSKKFKLAVGMDGEMVNAEVSLRFKDRGDVAGTQAGSETGFHLTDYLLNQALWTEIEWKPWSRLTLVPGLRGDFIKTKLSRHAFFDPRFNARFEAIKDTFFINAAAGLFHQEPTSEYMASTKFGNPGLRSERALHTAFGFSWKAAKSLSLDVTGFYKNIKDIVVSNPSPDESNPYVVTNDGIGRVFGAEVLFKKQTSSACPQIPGMKKCFAWLSYTFQKSELKESATENWRLFDFDQTHILTAVVSGIWPGEWQAGFRFRLSTGIPMTPYIGGVFDGDTGRYLPIEGRPFSQRLDTFHQLDFRIDKKINFTSWNLTIYLDIQNVYHHQSSEYYNYNFNYSRRKTLAGLPIIPSLGLKGAF